MTKIYLLGNPNVGKSAIFSRLTGLDIITSNYPGTTVEYTKGNIKVCKETLQILDTPGIYSLTNPTSKAEEVAVQLFSEITENDIVLNVVDSTNLERNLFLTLQLLEKKVPLIIILNKWDLVKQKGIEINVDNLANVMRVPIIPVVGISGEGVRNVFEKLKQFCDFGREFVLKTTRPNIPTTNDEKWTFIGNIVLKSQKIFHHHPTITEKIQELSITMPYAIFIALGILITSFFIIRTLGESLINYFFDPIFNKIYLPLIHRFVNFAIPGAGLKNFLLGKIPQPMESFGLLTTGVYVPFVVVLPYIFAFYFVLSFLEDSGYLVRLAVVMDRFFHKFGLHGYASIPVLLGLGCKVPAVLATRILESEREKIIAMVLILMTTPCMPQTAMIFAILSKFGLPSVLMVFCILIIVGLFSGYGFNKILKGESSELFVEIPSYQIPKIDILLKKLFLRIKVFFIEAVPMIILGIAIINVLDILGTVDFISTTFSPMMTKILGLPKEIAVVMISGFLRKDVSIALLTPFNLTEKQLIISSVVLVIYMPCIATFSMMVKEFKFWTSAKIVVVLFCISMILGVVLNLIL